MKRPNIIFILIDDMGWRDTGCYGSGFYETPEIDKLARQGMLFTDAYAAAPVCSPTRASILSGKYPARVGVTNWIGGGAKGKLIDAPYTRQLPLEEKSLAKALKEKGYSTWHVGKWHLGEKQFYPDRHGFDVNIGGCAWGHPHNGYFSPYGIENLEDGPEGEYLTDRMTDEAIKLIESNKEKPFFLNLWYYTVHAPIQAKESVIQKYREKRAESGLEEETEFEIGEFFPCEHNNHTRIKRRIVQSDPVYAAMVEILDKNIGRLMKSLKDSGQEENTMVVFTSDNGGLSSAGSSPTCNSPLSEGKGWMYEGGVREPLIVRWPGVVEPGSVCNTPVTSPDFYPTVLEAAGLPLIPGQHTDGQSMMPLLKGDGQFDREAIFWHYPHYGDNGGRPAASVRKGEFKLIEFFEDGHLELYDLLNDIGENDDLAEKMPDTAADLKGLLDCWKKQVNALMPVPNPAFKGKKT